MRSRHQIISRRNMQLNWRPGVFFPLRAMGTLGEVFGMPICVPRTTPCVFSMQHVFKCNTRQHHPTPTCCVSSSIPKMCVLAGLFRMAAPEATPTSPGSTRDDESSEWCADFVLHGDPKKLTKTLEVGGLSCFGPKNFFFVEFKLRSFCIILISKFTVQLTNSGPGMILRLPRCALIFKLFSGDWKMVGIRKPNDFFQFFQCHPSREETHLSLEVQFGSRLYCFLMFFFRHQMVHFYSEPGINK